MTASVPFRNRPIEALEAVAGGVTRHPGIVDFHIHALRLECAFELRWKCRIDRKTIAGDERVAQHDDADRLIRAPAGLRRGRRQRQSERDDPRPGLDRPAPGPI